MTTNNTTSNSIILDIEKAALRSRYKGEFEALADKNGHISSQRLNTYLRILDNRVEKFANAPLKIVNRTTEEIKSAELKSFEIELVREYVRKAQAERFKTMEIKEIPLVKKATPAPAPQPQFISPPSLWQRVRNQAAEACYNAPRLVAGAVAAVCVAVSIGVANETGTLNKLSKGFNKLTQRTPSALVTAVLDNMRTPSHAPMSFDQDIADDSILTSRSVFKRAAAQAGSFIAGATPSSMAFSKEINGMEAFTYR